MMDTFHAPVMAREVVLSLNCREGGVYVDGTLGGGGHAKAILERIGPTGLLIGIDRDEEAITWAKKVLAAFSRQFVLVMGNYADLEVILAERGIGEVDGIIFDLGASSHQLTAPHRGFSFSYPGPLDMRMGRDQRLDAYTVVNTFPERDLADIIREYGEERWSKRIARAIAERRATTPISTTTELAELIVSVMPHGAARSHIHPATRTFLALRVFINRELDHLRAGIASSLECIKPGGRFVVVTFHSLEDRIVKTAFKDASRACTCPPDIPQCVCDGIPKYRLVTRRAIRPSPQEVAKNPRARSAKLRVIERS